MKPPPFHYHDPETIADACGLLERLDNTKLLAGGQSLMPMLNMRFVLPDHVIDLNRVAALDGVHDDGDSIVIGAMTRQRTLEFSPVIKTRFPLIAEALRFVGHRQTRNRGTLGGSLCHLDPAAELVTVASVFDATLSVQNAAGARDIAFADFPLGFMMPALAQDELLTAVRFPAWPAGHRFGFAEYARRHGDFAIAAAAVLLTVDAAGVIRKAALAIGGLAEAPIRVREAEQALVGSTGAADAIEHVADLCSRLDAMGDALVPAQYRRHLAGVMARRALRQALG